MNDLPAILGGEPVRSQPPDWPSADGDVLAALEAAYQDGSWGKYDGRNCTELAARLSEYHQREHVVLCGSGTFAVELALRALKVGAGDEVILSAYDYPGNFLAVHAVGAHPVLVDPAEHNGNFTAETIAAAVSPATRALVVSHLHGGIVPMGQVMDAARAHGLAVIEDAAQSPGARVQGRPAGSWGDIGILSFGGSKLLTAGRGGALLTSRADIHQRARTLLFRGNLVCPLSELQAAVLVPQLQKLDERNQYRLRSVGRLVEMLSVVPELQPFINRTDDSSPAFYKVGFWYRGDRLSRRQVVCALRAEGVAFDEGFHAQHVGRSPRRFRAVGTLATAHRAHEQIVKLHHPILLGADRDIADVARAVGRVLAHAEQIAALARQA